MNVSESDCSLLAKTESTMDCAFDDEVVPVHQITYHDEQHEAVAADPRPSLADRLPLHTCANPETVALAGTHSLPEIEEALSNINRINLGAKLVKDVFTATHTTSGRRVVIKLAPAYEGALHLACQALKKEDGFGNTEFVYHPNAVQLFAVALLPPAMQVVSLFGGAIEFEPKATPHCVLVLEHAERGDMIDEHPHLQGAGQLHRPLSLTQTPWCADALNCLMVPRRFDHPEHQLTIAANSFLTHHAMFRAGHHVPRLRYTDAKPDNVFVRADGSFALGDFGGVCAVGEQLRNGKYTGQYFGVWHAVCHNNSDVFPAVMTIRRMLSDPPGFFWVVPSQQDYVRQVLNPDVQHRPSLEDVFQLV
eukprot:m.253255 g.253255  ORF g.253255 m.253255 type:complete len:363 (+) comp15481_c0_seq1:187-1275(+)